MHHLKILALSLFSTQRSTQEERKKPKMKKKEMNRKPALEIMRSRIFQTFQYKSNFKRNHIEALVLERHNDQK